LSTPLPDQPPLLNQTPLPKLELLPLQDPLQEPEPTPRLPHHSVEMELKNQPNNAKEEHAVLTDADFTRPIDHVDSDQQEQLKPVSERDDAMASEFADLLSSNKTPRRNARRPTEPRDYVPLPLVPAFKSSNFPK